MAKTKLTKVMNDYDENKYKVSIQNSNSKDVPIIRMTEKKNILKKGDVLFVLTPEELRDAIDSETKIANSIDKQTRMITELVRAVQGNTLKRTKKNV